MHICMYVENKNNLLLESEPCVIVLSHCNDARFQKSVGAYKIILKKYSFQNLIL